MPEDNIEGITLYSQLKSNDTTTTLQGMFSTANWQAGDVDFNKSLNESPKAAIAIGLAMDSCNQANHSENIVAGHYDDALSILTSHLASLAPRKVFLRIGYEFDGPWNCYQPDSYKAAFRKIASALQAKNASNVATVLQSAAWPDSYGNIDYDTSQTDHFGQVVPW